MQVSRGILTGGSRDGFLHAGDLLEEGVRDPSRPFLVASDLMDDGSGDPKLPGDSGADAPIKPNPKKRRLRATLLVHFVNLDSGKYSNSNMAVKDKIASAITAEVRPAGEIPRRLLALRKSLGMKQQDLARHLGVSQAVFSQYETGARRPSPQVLVGLSKIAEQPEQGWWLKQAGIAESHGESPRMTALGERAAKIPLLRDSAAAGIGRFIDEKDVEDVLLLPASWVPHPAGTRCIRVHGESMSPTLLDGYIVAVDTTLREPEKLVNEMVAARDPEGAVTIKWLRASKKKFMLVAQHTSPEYNPVILGDEPGWEIVGCVMWWIGRPPQKRRKR